MMSKYRRITASDQLDFSKLRDETNKAVIPVICVASNSSSVNAVLMLGFADPEAIDQTLVSQYATFWSRSRRSIWQKGETSGNTMLVSAVYGDCDNDSVVYLISSNNPVCHTGSVTCFQLTTKEKKDEK